MIRICIGLWWQRWDRGHLHELLLGAIGAKDVCPVGDEALAHQGALAHGTDEAIIVPVPIFEGDEAGATNAGDGLSASSAPLGKELSEAVSAIGLVIPGGKALAGQRSVTVGASEALPVPGLALVSHTT